MKDPDRWHNLLTGFDSKAHELRSWPGPFDAVKEGRKTFELRTDDRSYRVGDRLHLRRWDPELADYTGAEIVVVVTHLLRARDLPGLDLLASNVVCMSIRIV